MGTSTKGAWLVGEIDGWPSKRELADMFRSGGFGIDEGRYAIRLTDIDHFVFRELGGDVGPGSITADHDLAEELAAFAHRVSETLGKASVRHRFEIYSETEELVSYLHYDWPHER